MKDQANSVLKSIQQFWKAQTNKQRITYLSIIGGVIIIAIIVSAMLNKTDYVVLYTGLESKEAAEILTEIQTMKVDAKIQGDGTVLVPKDQDNTIRMQLATKGYPKSGFSYDIWTSNTNMFTTDSQQKEIKKMQLETRMQANFQILDGVKQAVVNIDIPETSSTVISTNTKKPSVGITLILTNGVALPAASIKGIAHIAMTSISGLTADSVSIIDGTGKLLYPTGKDGDSAEIESEKLKLQNDYQDTIKAKILDLLQPSYGVNGIKVAVNADLNFDKKVSEITTHTPSVGDKGIPTHEDESSETSNDGTSGGVVGVTPNADGTNPTGTTTTTGGTASNYSKSTDYAVNVMKEQTEKSGFTIEKVTVGITVYADVLGETEKSDIVNIASSVAATPKDLISVAKMKTFVDKTVDVNGKPINPTLYFGYTLNQLLIVAGIVFIILLIIIIFIITLLSKSKKNKKTSTKRLPNAKETGELAFAQAQNIDIKKLSDKVPETKEAAIRREIGDFTKNSPEIAAQLLKSWIREESD